MEGDGFIAGSKVCDDFVDCFFGNTQCGSYGYRFVGAPEGADTEWSTTQVAATRVKCVELVGEREFVKVFSPQSVLELDFLGDKA